MITPEELERLRKERVEELIEMKRILKEKIESVIREEIEKAQNTEEVYKAIATAREKLEKDFWAMTRVKGELRAILQLN